MVKKQAAAPKVVKKVLKIDLFAVTTNDMNARLEVVEANIQKIADYING